ncbi:hypothetical protein RN001_014068 [Aquatica leii]|uniref:Oxidoreductase-like domain-containing protein n=1 Tax=Aquatica leii TaxID=1421715 RepID=A0AAN7SLV8_9COLE|nr:hypothetical protein RN001_014068 [Aquatica leii]
MVFALRFRNARHIPTLNVSCIHNSFQKRSESKSSNTDDSNNSNVKQEEEPLQPPTNCCMSNCPNCVWIDYAQKLSNYYKDGGEKAMKEINEHITDSSLKAFVLMEIRIRKKFG